MLVTEDKAENVDSTSDRTVATKAIKSTFPHLLEVQSPSQQTPRPGSETRRCGRRIYLRQYPETKNKVRSQNIFTSHIKSKAEGFFVWSW